ncbi:nuclear-interacting partner of ALK-like [Anneissia japonica]|uniref:nuclear-interacting partner of ALK-like n=1 Tax=Anneissia japonica TaxID=1529436 RepID=UPI001425A76A|nr:nuclear-interacting partner of ALK-like [Anneissia japonica]
MALRSRALGKSEKVNSAIIHIHGGVSLVSSRSRKMDISNLSRSKSTPRKVKDLLSSFIYGSVSDDNQCLLKACNEKKPSELPSDDVDGWSQKDDSLVDHKRVFHPDDKKAYYQRVQTYTSFIWVEPLAALSPLMCARYGWKCINVNTLKCVSCKEVLYVGIPDNITYEQECDASKKIIQLISTAHLDICPWPTSPSPEKFSMVVETTRKSTSLEFVNRVESMLKDKSTLPSLDVDFIASEDVDVTDVINTIRNMYSELQENDKLDDAEICAAVFLALFGWTNSELDGGSIIVCNHCKRSAGMWNFTLLKYKEKDKVETELAGDSGDNLEPEPKRRRLMKFNPCTEHRTWCPWISSMNTNVEDASTPTDSKECEKVTPPLTKGTDTDAEDEVIKQMLEQVDPSEVGWKQVLQSLKRYLLVEPSDEPRPTLANTTPPSKAWQTFKRILGYFQGKSPEKT